MTRRRPSSVTRQLRTGSPDRVRTTSLVLPKALHRRAADAAREQGWSLAEVFRTALTAWLDARETVARKRTGR